MFTKRPEFTGNDGYVSLDVGERGHGLLEGGINLPVSENLAFRVAGFHSQEDGYVNNPFKPTQNNLIAHDNSGGRISTRYQQDTIDVNFMVEYEHREQSGSMYRATEKGEAWDTWLALVPGIEMPKDNRNISSNMGLGEEDNANIWSYDLQIDWDLGFATLTSQTGFKDHEYVYAEDFDAMSVAVNDYAQNQKGRYFEQELRLVSQGSDALSWYAGVSYYQEEIDALFTQHAAEDAMCLFYYSGQTCAQAFPGFTYSPIGLLEANRDKGEYEGWAAYVDLSYAFNDLFDASLGVRYTFDKKQFKLNALPVESELGPFWAMGFTTDGYLHDTKDFDEFTPRAIVRYHPTSDWMVFASVTRGYKSGGFGSFAITPDQPFGTVDVTQGDASPDTFDPETVWSYEIGTKGEVYRRPRQACRQRVLLHVRRPAGERARHRRRHRRRQRRQGGWLGRRKHARVDRHGQHRSVSRRRLWQTPKRRKPKRYAIGDSACDGKPLPQVPKYSGSAVVNVHFPARDGDIVFTTELYGQSRTYGGLLQLNEAVNDAYVDLTLRGGFRATSGWSAIAYVENVTDEVSYDGVAEGGDILPAHFFGPSRPRTVGLQVSWDF